MIDVVELRKAQLKITRENLADLDETMRQMDKRGIMRVTPDQRDELKHELEERERFLLDLIKHGSNVITLEEGQMIKDMKEVREVRVKSGVPGFCPDLI